MEPYLTLRQVLCDQRMRILVVDDRSFVRSLLRQLIDSEPDMMVIGEADDEISAIVETHKLKPDLVVMNLSTPIENAILATKHLMEDCAAVKVILCTVLEEEILLPHAVEAGASAVIFQSRVPDDLVRTIRGLRYT